MSVSFSPSDLPAIIAPGSYVKVSRLRDGHFCVVTYDRTSDITVKISGRWFGQSEGEAFLIAQLIEARGYQWRRA